MKQSNARGKYPLAPKVDVCLPSSHCSRRPMLTWPCGLAGGQLTCYNTSQPMEYRGILSLNGNVSRCRIMHASSYLSGPTGPLTFIHSRRALYASQGCTYQPWISLTLASPSSHQCRTSNWRSSANCRHGDDVVYLSPNRTTMNRTRYMPHPYQYIFKDIQCTYLD
jgi:hypothetical protein